MAECCEANAASCWAYRLMPNHIHLVLAPQTPEGLSRAVGEAHRRWTRRIFSRRCGCAPSPSCARSAGFRSRALAACERGGASCRPPGRTCGRRLVGVVAADYFRAFRAA
ncbi:hypothetical protein CQW49_13630 [Methylosinus trichosporium OB3b]|uniref:Transposase IS200-like domain-containing protein n=1 Tax=Methylosinus trichosporium (strain ATCC 35070 / NCIMB 11131 / UNIQEM 75 / OB3b) TaxID=595536 RepID=A0A2D2D1C6_METT3|nr:hypothetical protein CQW49_13630 [Methylosinus trichosporium OB3b]OBS51489.1 hypothetical protein A8B73_15995 [Methylosinus sp. 3S-1]